MLKQSPAAGHKARKGATVMIAVGVLGADDSDSHHHHHAEHSRDADSTGGERVSR